MDILLILIVLLFIVFVWRGPKMLPRIGAVFGKTVKDVRQSLPGAARDETVDSVEPSDKPGA